MQTHGDLTPFPQPHYPGGSPSIEMTSWPGPAYNLDRTRAISPVHTSAPPHQADKLKADFKGEIIHACPAIPMFPIMPWAEAQRHPGIPRSGLLQKPPAAAVTPTQHCGCCRKEACCLQAAQPANRSGAQAGSASYRRTDFLRPDLSERKRKTNY